MTWIAMIRLEKGLFLAQNNPISPDARPHNSGWQPWKWTRKFEEAEKFDTREKAEAWASRNIPHDRWEVVAFPIGRSEGNYA